MKRMKKKIMSNLNNVKGFSGEGYGILEKKFKKKLIIGHRLKNLIAPVYASGRVILLKIASIRASRPWDVKTQRPVYIKVVCSADVRSPSDFVQWDCIEGTRIVRRVGFFPGRYLNVGPLPNNRSFI